MKPIETILAAKHRFEDHLVMKVLFGHPQVTFVTSIRAQVRQDFVHAAMFGAEHFLDLSAAERRKELPPANPQSSARPQEPYGCLRA